MRISYTRIRLLAVLYAVIPVIIFFFGWLSVLWAAVFSVLLLAAVFFFARSSESKDGKKAGLFMSKKNLVLIGVIAFVWCFLAGQGGYIHQSNDNIIRNAIFRDLIVKPWPVIYSDGSMLSYYIAHWMVPALFGKLFFAVSGSAEAGFAAGNFFLLLWTFIGVFLTLLLVIILTCSKKNAHIFASTVMFIFFSGLDLLGTALIIGMPHEAHLEWWADFVQYSSFSTCLFWVYNQTVTIWLMTLCIINERKVNNFALLGLLALPFGPLPFIGIVGICVIKAALLSIELIKRRQTGKVLRNIFSVPNIFSAAAILPVYYLYYSSNAIASNNAVFEDGRMDVGFRVNGFLKGSVFSGSTGEAVRAVILYILFLALEAGIYIAAVLIFNKLKNRKTSPEFFGIISMLVIIPLFQFGESGDFAMRVSIPPLVCLAVEFIKTVIGELPSNNEMTTRSGHIVKNTWLAASLFVFLIGSATAVTEFYREIRDTIVCAVTRTIPEEIISMDDVEIKNNFTAKEYTDSKFYKYISKKG